MIAGGCHCGALRYEVRGEPITAALCHCEDCRRHAGAPVVAWAMYREDEVKIVKGLPKIYASSEHGRRHFCADCGTNILYINAETLRGLLDIQVATLDNPADVIPQKHVQVAERIGWMEGAQALPLHERYPPRQ
jgi:hypothetical protein